MPRDRGARGGGGWRRLAAITGDEKPSCSSPLCSSAFSRNRLARSVQLRRKNEFWPPPRCLCLRARIGDRSRGPCLFGPAAHHFQDRAGTALGANLRGKIGGADRRGPSVFTGD